MGTIFEDAAAAHSRAADAVFSEPFLYQPFCVAAGDVNGRPSPDPVRPELRIVGYYIEGYARAFAAETRKQGVKPEHPGHASARPQLDLDIKQLHYAPRNGDRVVRLKTGAIYHVAEIKFPTAGPRCQIDLNRIEPGSPTRGR